MRTPGMNSNNADLPEPAGHAAGSHNPNTAELTPPPSAEHGHPSSFSPVTRMSRDDTNDTPPSPAPSSGSSASHPAFKLSGMPLPGQVIFDRYQIIRQLGEGGMGSVWLVQHLGLNAERALKLIMAEIAADNQIRARFKREARVMAKLTHPNAVTVHDSKLAKEAAFIEMEFVRGQSLNKLLRPGRPMPLDWVGRVLEQLCDVLQEAHSLGIVHRDLKPSNLMLVEGRPVGREHLKVLDFGIAKLLTNDGADGDDVKTMANTFIGTAHYSSPEQIRGAQVDGRSDLYSTGVILYELLTGQRPFSGTAQLLICDHLSTAPLPFAVKDPETTVPPEVERMVLRCLAKDAADRPQSASELSKEFLQAVAAGSAKRTAVSLSDSAKKATKPDSALAPTKVGPDSATKKSITNPSQPAPVGLLSPRRSTPDATLTKSATASQISKKPIKRRWPMVVSGRFLALLLACGLGGFVLWNTKFRGTAGTTPIKITTDANPACFAPSAEASRRILAWERAGYMPVKADCTNSEGWPQTLRKEHSGSEVAISYYLSKSGHYLPKGYEPDGDDLAEDDWPKVLVRAADKARFVRIVGGTFHMGCLVGATPQERGENTPQHSVTIPSFYMQEAEATNGEVDAWVWTLSDDENSKTFKSEYASAKTSQGDNAANLPAVKLNHEFAERFCLSRSGYLPTEEQWEFAARSCSAHPSLAEGNLYVWSPQNPPATTQLKELGNIDSADLVKGKMFATDKTLQGVFDMAGNVQEWCRDVYGKYENDNRAGSAAAGPARLGDGKDSFVIRGGAFDSSTWEQVQTTTRSERPEGDATRKIGFRMVLEPPDFSPGKAATGK